MSYRLMCLPTIRLLRLIGLVRVVEPVEAAGDARWRWAVLVRGRGFQRLVEDDLLEAPALHRPRSALERRAKRFPSHAAAKRFLRSVALDDGGSR